jgi:hypothetical protein
MRKMAQVNGQIDLDVFAGLTEIADEMNIKPSTLVGKIVTDYVQIYAYKIQRGDVTLSKPIIKKIFEMIDPSKIDEIAEYTANFIISEIKSQEGKITYDILLEHFTKWNKGRFQFNQIRQDGTDIIISKHMVCKNWSEIQCKTYANCLKMIGEEVLEMEFDSDTTYSFEVVRRE